MNFLDVAHLLESAVVSEGNEDDAVVGKGGEGGHGSDFLATSKRGGRDKHTGVLAAKGALGPEVSGSIPERLARMASVIFNHFE